MGFMVEVDIFLCFYSFHPVRKALEQPGCSQNMDDQCQDVPGNYNQLFVCVAVADIEDIR